MTRDEIDRALNREVSAAVLGAADEGLIQAILALRDVCKNQEERLRALEQAQENERERLAGADW